MQQPEENILSDQTPEFTENSPFVSQDRPLYLGKTYRFRFHGQAMEYFGIWFINILLTIVTLSLYAPWAKVRRLRYFYTNTAFFDRAFDFTGLPTKILIGRLIALGLYAAVSFGSMFAPTLTFIGFLIIYLAIPWLVRATIRFNSRNSKFGNSRFYFSGSTKQAYWLFLKAILISIATLGIFAPVAIWLYKKYLVDHLYVGQLKFNLTNSWSNYMSAVYIPIFLFWGLLAIIGILFAALYGVMSTGQGININLSQLGIYLIIAVYILLLFFIGPLIQARIYITTWNHTRLGDSQFQTDCNQWKYTWIVASNWIIKVLSLGLMSAWAAIRLYKYQVESLSLQLEDDPNQMINLAQTDHNAIAEEISDIFDLDISL
nr:YjgN family protein [Acinetobacter sp. Marseille-Q1620]